MSQRTTARAERKNAMPLVSGLLRHTAVRPVADHDTPVMGQPGPGFEHDFSQTAVRPSAPMVGQSYATSACPVFPRRCPFGGACHVCPAPAQVQTKLKVNKLGDKYEQEADRVAEQVMRMPEPQAKQKTEVSNRAPIPSINLKRRATHQITPSTAPPIVHEVLRSPGQPLDPVTRTTMESRFGHDFSRVPVRTAVPMMIQAKLAIGQPGDEYEKEADRVTDLVMRMPEPGIQLKPTCAGGIGPSCGDEDMEEELVQSKPIAGQITPLVQRQVVPGEEEEEPVQAKLADGTQVQCQEEEPEEEEFIWATQTNGQTPQVGLGLEVQIHSLIDGGQSLTQSERRFFEPRFGCDFSRVHVHTDAQAADSAKAVNARAFTMGQDVVFGAGQYAPGTTRGKRLLAHELTHVVQQDESCQFLSLTSKQVPQLRHKISLANGNRIARWAISGNTATVNRRSDRLWNLAKRITGNGRDWPCIWPKHMQSPRAWDDPYERFLIIGDTFDISNLNLTTGPSATFTFQLADDDLQTMQIMYGGTDPINLEQEIAALANNGETPIRNLTLCGHTSGDTIWGDNARFSTAGLNSERPAPSGAGAHNKMGPRRCWFTRNANVRIVGCTSTTVAASFASVFLRRGAQALGTNHWVCWWHQTAPTDARFASVEGPPCNWPPTAPRLGTAAAVNGAAGLWVTTQGRL